MSEDRLGRGRRATDGLATLRQAARRSDDANAQVAAPHLDLSQPMHHPGQMSNLCAALAIQRIERCRYGKVRREINNGGS